MEAACSKSAMDLLSSKSGIKDSPELLYLKATYRAMARDSNNWSQQVLHSARLVQLLKLTEKCQVSIN
jgi:hypothetical protein